MKLSGTRSLAVVLGIGYLALIAATGCQRLAGGANAGSSATNPAPGTQHPAPSPVQFVDITAEAGIRFRHTSGWARRFYLAETLGSGCAFLDYNGDGRLDLFFVNSSRLPGFTEKGPFYPALYRNEGISPEAKWSASLPTNTAATGSPRFRDVTREAGLTVDCYGIGTAIADYDNDGDPDLLLTAYGGSHLFRNDRGRFTEVTRKAGVTGPEWGTSAAWFDYDRDGRLDLFIGNYVKWSPTENLVCGSKALRYACPPSHYPATASVLYRNNGDGTFTDVTRAAKVDRDNGKALGVVVWDVDDDGWLDLAVANDAQPNWLYRNNGESAGGAASAGRSVDPRRAPGTFTEIGVEAGMAYGMQGRQRAGMGIDTADFDHSGREAILIGNLSGEGLALFRPTETADQFADRAVEAGLFQASLPYTTFGARFFDYDLDGYPDILTANGHVNEEVSANAGTFRYEQRLQLFHNEPGAAGRQFRDVTASAGEAFAIERTWRGLAVGDVDGDGDPDVLLSANRGAAALLRNEVIRGRIHRPLASLARAAEDAEETRSESMPGESVSTSPDSSLRTSASSAALAKRAVNSPTQPHWLTVKLIGTKSNRDGIGSRLRLTAGGDTQTGWVRSGGSYASEDERVARFGLGRESRVERLEIRWPNGAVEQLRDLTADRVLTVREGQAGR